MDGRKRRSICAPATASQLVSGQRRYSDARLTEAEFNSAGPDMKRLMLAQTLD